MSSVICGVLFSFVLLVCQHMTAGADSQGDLRLASNGLVELFDEQKWQAICSTGWDEKDAEVVCRQLKKDAFAFLFFKVDDANPSVSDGFDCKGNEEQLLNCKPLLETCDSDSRAAVTCVSGLSTPVIAGIAVGCLVFLLIGAGSIAGFIKFKNDDDDDDDA